MRLNVLEARDQCKRLRIYWTPTIVFLDPEGNEHHRFTGYFPPDEYAPHVNFARGREAFAKGNFQVALDAYATVVDRWPKCDLAPESLYWSGVARYRLTKDEPKLMDACREVVKRYPNHVWAKKFPFVS